MTAVTVALCRHCRREIRLTPAGWGHVEPYRVGAMHPLHRATPERAS